MAHDLANNAQPSGGSGHIFGVIYLFWILTHLNLLFSRHPLARMVSVSLLMFLRSAKCCFQEPGTSFYLSVVASGREDIFDLWAKLDKSLPKSVIAKEKADLTKGIVLEEPTPSQFKDSQGAEYSTKASITLRCRYGESQQTFNETFYIVDSCPFDALLGRNVKKGSLKDKPGCFPLQFRRKTEGKHTRNATDKEVMS
jgi:hypothetical protein